MARVRKVLLRVALLSVALLGALKLLDLWVGRADPWGTVASTTNGRLYQRLTIKDRQSIRLFRHRPNLNQRMHDYTFRTDSLGLRGKELERPKPAGVRRVFFLGDSIVVACGVEEPDTFVQRTARALAERTGQTWEGVNGGHQMHDSVQELAVLREVGFEYEPDVVVLVYCSNDIVSTRRTFEAARKARADAPDADAEQYFTWSDRLRAIEPWYPNLFSIGHFWLVLHRPVGQRGSVEGARALGLEVDLGWQESQQAMREMRDECRSRGIPFAVVSFERGIALSDELRDFCAAEEIPWANVGYEKGEEGLHLRLSRADAHPNGEGHRLLAERITEFLLTTPALRVTE